jgi:hypothetical protein
LAFCDAITYAGIKDIIEHCKELCYLKLDARSGLQFQIADMNAIYEQLLKTGKQVDHTKYDDNCYDHQKMHHFEIYKKG